MKSLDFKYFLARPLALAIAGVTSHTVSAATEPASVALGGFNLVPVLGFEQRYDDNYLSSKEGDEVSTWVSVITPAVQATLDTGKSVYTLGLGLDAGFYTEDSADNYVDVDTYGSADWQLHRIHALGIRAGWKDEHEDRGSGFSQGGGTDLEEPDLYEELSYGANYTLGTTESAGRIVLDYDYLEKVFTNHREQTEGRDREDDALKGTFYWGVAPRTDILLEAAYTDINYLNDPVILGLDSEELAYKVGITWEATAKTTGIIKVGRTEKEFASALREDFDGTSWEVQMDWSPLTYSTVSLNTGRQPQETNGTGNFIDEETYGIRWAHEWSSFVDSSISWNKSEEDYVGIIDAVGRDDETDTYDFRLNYDMRRWLSFGVAYTYTDKDSSNEDFAFEKNQYSLFVDMSL